MHGPGTVQYTNTRLFTSCITSFFHGIMTSYILPQTSDTRARMFRITSRAMICTKKMLRHIFPYSALQFPKLSVFNACSNFHSADLAAERLSFYKRVLKNGYETCRIIVASAFRRCSTDACNTLRHFVVRVSSKEYGRRRLACMIRCCT
jgi:hypothetical protein